MIPEYDPIKTTNRIVSEDVLLTALLPITLSVDTTLFTRITKCYGSVRNAAILNEKFPHGLE